MDKINKPTPYKNPYGQNENDLIGVKISDKTTIEEISDQLGEYNGGLNILNHRLSLLIDRFDGNYERKSDPNPDACKEPNGLREKIGMYLNYINQNLTYLNNHINALEKII